MLGKHLDATEKETFATANNCQVTLLHISLLFRIKPVLSALLYIYRDATLITFAKNAQKITAVARGKPLPKMRCFSEASSSELSIGLCVRISKRIDRGSRLMGTGRFDGYDCKKKKSRLVHSGPHTMSAKTKETQK